MKPYTAQRYALQVRTLCPLYIGDNDTKQRSAYADYILSANQDEVLYLDEQRLANELSRLNKIDAYLAGIKKGMNNNRSDFDLRRFLLERLQLDEEAIVRLRLPQHGLPPTGRLPISPTVRATGKPYLPGSSLKGALRTAILYHWLTATESGARHLRQNFRQIQGLEDILRRKARVREQAYNKQDERQRMRDILREETQILRRLFDETELFGQITESDARLIRVSDSELLPPDAAAVYATYRRRLAPLPKNVRSQADNDIPQIREGIPPGQTLACELSLHPPFRHPDLATLAAADSREWLHTINRFAEDCLDNELWQLDEAARNGGIYAERAAALTDFYTQLKYRVQTEGKERLFLRLGAGKTVYDNSLLLALIYGDEKQKEEERYFRMLRESLFRQPAARNLFPVTRTLTANDQPWGWVEVKVEQLKK